jgi:hypothetical protein
MTITTEQLMELAEHNLDHLYRQGDLEEYLCFLYRELRDHSAKWEEILTQSYQEMTKEKETWETAQQLK